MACCRCRHTPPHRASVFQRQMVARKAQGTAASSRDIPRPLGVWVDISEISFVTGTPLHLDLGSPLAFLHQQRGVVCGLNSQKSRRPGRCSFGPGRCSCAGGGLGRARLWNRPHCACVYNVDWHRPAPPPPAHLGERRRHWAQSHGAPTATIEAWASFSAQAPQRTACISAESSGLPLASSRRTQNLAWYASLASSFGGCYCAGRKLTLFTRKLSTSSSLNK